MKRYFIRTLGCKVNRFESDAISGSLAGDGWEPVPDPESADLILINTCTVTGKASMQSRQAIRKARRDNPTARIVVTGCYAQTEPEILSRMPEADVIVGHGEKTGIPGRLRSLSAEPAGKQVHVGDVRKERVFRDDGTAVQTDRTRAFLKIQDGCDAFCSYCIVPHARGPSRSRPFSDVLERLRRLARDGYKEVVLSGIHLGAWGRDLSPQQALSDVLERIVADRIVPRVRLSSIEPVELTRPILDLAAQSDVICPHFHIPLQSGDDAVLKRMGRPYTAGFFAEQVHRLLSALPDAAIGVDCLVGFPGETDAEFESTRALVESLPVAYLHVFPFSPRKGTPAARLPDPVAPAAVKSRTETLRRMSIDKRKRFYGRMTGKTLDALILCETEKKTGFTRGLTGNYLPVAVPGEGFPANEIIPVRVASVGEDLSVIATRVR